MSDESEEESEEGEAEDTLGVRRGAAGGAGFGGAPAGKGKSGCDRSRRLKCCNGGPGRAPEALLARATAGSAMGLQRFSWKLPHFLHDSSILCSSVSGREESLWLPMKVSDKQCLC